MKKRLIIAAIATTFSLGACIKPSAVEPRFISDIRPVPPTHKVVSYSIQRQDLRKALTRLRESPIRLVPVFQSVSTTESFEYRIFDIDGGGVYGLLGLENSDIIVAANEFLIKDPKQFPLFVQLLERENTATIEIRRNGEARLLKYAFIPTVSRNR